MFINNQFFKFLYWNWTSSDPLIPIPSPVRRFLIKLLMYGFCSNTWIWIHILIGALGARFFLSVCHFSSQVTMIIVISVALLWEVLEGAMQPIRRIYGSWSRFLFDSTGDVLGAVIAAGIVVI